MNKDLLGSLSWGVGIVVLALGATYARQLGYMDTTRSPGLSWARRG